MSTEIDDLKMRVASLEDEFRAVFGKAETIEPAPGSDAEHPPVGYVLVPSASDDRIKADWLVWAWDRGPWESFPSDGIGYARNRSRCAVCRPIPANEGDLRLAESVAIPVGWVLGFPEGANFRYWCKDETGGGFWGTTARTCVTVRDLMIVPDPSIPWGEGYEAILPSEATEGDEYWSVDRWWKSGGGRCHPSVPGYFAWRRRIPATTPTECDHDWRYASRWTKPGFESCARCQKCDARKWDPTTPTEPARDLSAEVERLEAELRAMTERAENFGRVLRFIAEYKGLYIDSEAFYATRKIARVAIANEGKKA